MLNRFVGFILLLSFFSLPTLAEIDIDQWQDSDKTYKDLVEDGFP